MSLIQSNVVTKTNFSANGQTLELDVSNLNAVRFEFVGTYNFTASFETLGLDGATYYPLQAAMVNSSVIALSHSTANATQAYEANVSGVSKVRIRLTAFTSAAVHSVAISGSDAAIDPAPVIVVGAGAASIGVVATPAGSGISVVTAATTNASIQKASAGNLFEVSISNPTATAISVKFYNKATAPTVGTDTPVFTLTVAAGATVNPQLGNIGKRFTTGIALAATALPAASDTGVAVAGVQIHGSYI